MTKENKDILIGIIIFIVIGFFLYRENNPFTLGFLLAVLLFQIRINRKIDEQKEINKDITDNFVNHFKMIEHNSRVIGKIIDYLQGRDNFDKSSMN
jgi:hypothetical protein